MSGVGKKVVGADLPLVSVVDAATMKRLKVLIGEIHEAVTCRQEYEKLEKAAKAELEELYLKSKVLREKAPDGFRFGDRGLIRSYATKRTLSAKLLVEAGVETSVIERCYTETEYAKVTLWSAGERGEKGED